MRHAGTGLEETVRAKASYSGPSEAKELADARQLKSEPKARARSQSQEESRAPELCTSLVLFIIIY